MFASVDVRELAAAVGRARAGDSGAARVAVPDAVREQPSVPHVRAGTDGLASALSRAVRARALSTTTSCGIARVPPSLVAGDVIARGAVGAVLARQPDVLGIPRIETPSRTWGYSLRDVGPPSVEDRDAVRSAGARQVRTNFRENWDADWFASAEYQEDYLRILELLVDKDQTEVALAPLEQRLVLEQNVNPRGALERALKHFEGRFGFSTRQVIPLAILPPDEFKGLYATGVVPKDIGAGLSHGEMSHRIQWIAIMTAFEQNPGPWHFTPLRLLVGLGRSEFSRMQFVLMDTGGVHFGKGYTQPDNIVRFMRDDAETHARLPRLSAELTRRWTKRQHLAWEWAAQPDDVASRNRALTTRYMQIKQSAKWQPTPLGAMLVDMTAPAEPSLDDRLRQQRMQWNKPHA